MLLGLCLQGAEAEHHRNKLGGGDGLRDMDLKARLKGEPAVVLGPVGGERPCRDGAPVPGIEASHRVNEVVAVAGGHADVAHQDVRAPFSEEGQGLCGHRGGGDLRAVPYEDGGEQLAGVRLVVDQQHPDTLERRRRDEKRGR